MRSLAILYAALLAGIVLLADTGALGPFVSALHAIPLGDKVAHLVLASVLGHLAAAYPGAPRIGGLPAGTWFVALVATLEEVSQQVIPGRTFDWLDLAADAGGIAIGTWLALLRRQTDRVTEH